MSFFRLSYFLLILLELGDASKSDTLSQSWLCYQWVEKNFPFLGQVQFSLWIKECLVKLIFINSLLLPSPFRQSWYSATCLACVIVWCSSTQDAENFLEELQEFSISPVLKFIMVFLGQRSHFVSSPWLLIKILNNMCLTVKHQGLHYFPVINTHEAIDFYPLSSESSYVKSQNTVAYATVPQST